jgi:hypothetical protein
MAILCISTLPKEVTLEQVMGTSKAIAAGGPPAGGISHAVTVDGGQIKVYDVWESEEALNTFTTERLIPAIQASMTSMGMDPATMPQPEIQIFEAHDAMGVPQ